MGEKADTLDEISASHYKFIMQNTQILQIFCDLFSWLNTQIPESVVYTNTIILYYNTLKYTIELYYHIRRYIVGKYPQHCAAASSSADTGGEVPSPSCNVVNKELCMGSRSVDYGFEC